MSRRWLTGLMSTQTKSRRLVRLVLGWLLLAAGVAALILPGPGLLLLAAGLAMLSQQYSWAERRLAPVKDKAFAVASASVRNFRNIVASAVLAVVMSGIGVLWGLRPAAQAGGHSANVGGCLAAGAQAPASSDQA